MTTTLRETLERLEHALDGLAIALRSADAGATLRAEEPLASAVSEMHRLKRSDIAAASPLDIRLATARVRDALARCESLGETVQALNQVVTPEMAYGPRTRRPTIATARRAAARS